MDTLSKDCFEAVGFQQLARRSNLFSLFARIFSETRVLNRDTKEQMLTPLQFIMHFGLRTMNVDSTLV